MKLSLASLLALGLAVAQAADIGTTVPQFIFSTTISRLPPAAATHLISNSTLVPKISWPEISQALSDNSGGGGGGGGGDPFHPDPNYPCDATPRDCPLQKILIAVIVKIRVFIQSLVVRVNCPPVVPVVGELEVILLELIAKLNVLLPSEGILEVVASIWFRGWTCIRKLIEVIVIIIEYGWKPPPGPQPLPPPVCIPNYPCSNFPPPVVIPPQDSVIIFFCNALKFLERSWYSYCKACPSVVPYSKALEPVSNPRASMIALGRNLTTELVEVHRLAPETQLVTSDQFKTELKIASNWELLSNVVTGLKPVLNFISYAFPGVSSNVVGSLQTIIGQISGQLYNGLPIHEYMPTQAISPLWGQATGKVEQLISSLSTEATRGGNGSDKPMSLILDILRSFLASMKQIFSPMSKVTGVESREALASMLDDIGKLQQVI
ncbi:hypothetical protein TYRP_001577 [Tyrophagus putrescentiae]|nr:hypothetical protein TYRP_001577 [Tyrophagus putrescentiae]